MEEPTDESHWRWSWYLTLGKPHSQNMLCYYYINATRKLT